MNLNRLHKACRNRKSASQGGMNIDQIKDTLLKIFPNQAHHILSASSRTNLEQLCVQLLSTTPDLKLIDNSYNIQEVSPQLSPKQLSPKQLSHKQSFIEKQTSPQYKPIIKITTKKPTTKSENVTDNLNNIISVMQDKGYKLQEQIGKGASGIVYKAISNDGEIVIIKFIPKNKARSIIGEKYIPTYLNLLKNKCRNDLTCLLDYDMDQSYYAFVNRFISGKTLNNINLSSLSFKQKLEIAINMANAIAFMHDSGVIHRDIKPGNTMINIIRDKISTGIIDMDLACIRNDNLKSWYDTDNNEDKLKLNCMHSGGTPSYLAPELYKKSKKNQILNQSAIDIYSLGMTYYYIFHNKKSLFTECSGDLDCIYTIKISPQIYQSIKTSNSILDNLIGSMLDKNPQNRPDIHQVLDILYSIK